MVQTNWTSLGQPGSNPATSFFPPQVVQNADGRLEVLLIGSDGNLWHIWQTIPGKAWSSWATLNTLPSTLSTPIAARNADGRIEAFCIGTDGALWHIWQTAPSNGWGTWFSSGRPSASVGLVGDLTCVEMNTNGRLEVFALGTDGALWHIWQTVPNGTWSSWASLAKPPTTSSTFLFLGSGTNADGRIEVFTVGSDGALWHIWQTVPGGSWSSWFSSGMPASGLRGQPLIVSRNFDGRLEVFVIGNDNTLYHIWQQTPNGTWGGWFTLGQPPSAHLTDNGRVAQNQDGHLEFLMNADDGTFWHIWQTDGGKNWGSWHSLGNPPGTSTIAAPCVIANADGRLEAFTRAIDKALWHTWQVTPGGNWGG